MLSILSLLSCSSTSKNITFKNISYGDHSDQKLDIYPLANPSKKKSPIVIMVHGGAWMIGDKANKKVITNKIAHYHQKNIMFASVNYRLSIINPDPIEQAQDVKMAIEYIIKNASKYNIDKEKIILMGHSAGAHLITLLNSKGEIPKMVKGVVALDSAAYDLVAIMEAKHPKFYDKVFGNKKDLWIEMSPYHQFKNSQIPMLLVCSLKRSNACSQAKNLQNKIQELNGKADVLSLQMNHSEINDFVGKNVNYTEQLDQWMKAMTQDST